MRVLLAASVAFLASTTAVDATHRQLKGSLADAPSVKLHVTFKRKAMKLHGQSEFDVYATPVVSANGASVLYNGYASFQDEDTDFTVVNHAVRRVNFFSFVCDSSNLGALVASTTAADLHDPQWIVSSYPHGALFVYRLYVEQNG
ncbi:hypothetical protein PRIC1_005413 [Phytophthora ramorum]